MKEYTKVFKTEKDYVIKYNGQKFPKIVSENQDLYQAWLAAGNAPDEVAYVAPPKPKALTVSQLKEMALSQADSEKREAHEKAVWEKSTEYGELQTLNTQINSATKEQLANFIDSGELS